MSRLASGLVALWLLLVALPCAAQHGPGPTAPPAPGAPGLAAWVDVSGKASADMAAAQQFQPLTGAVAVPRPPARLWLRWQQPAGQPASQFFWLEYPRLAVLEAWAPADGLWSRTGLAGTRVPRSDWTVDTRLPVVRVPPSPLERPVLFAAQSEVPQRVGWRMADSAGVASSFQREAMLLGAFFGVGAIALWFWGVIAVTHRDRALLAGGLTTLVAFSAQAAYLGMGSQYLWPDMPGWTWPLSQGLSALLLLSLPGMVWATTTVAQRPRPMGALLLACSGLIVLASAVAAGAGTYAVSLTQDALFPVTVAVCGIVAWQAARRGNRHVGPIALALVPALIGGTVQVLRDADWIAGDSLWTQFALQIGTLLSVPMLLWALQHRARELHDARLRRGSIHQTDPATGLATEALARLRVERMQLRARRFNHRSGVLLVELANLDALQHTHGRRAAEGSVLVAASRLRRIAGEFDTAARWHGDQFLLLIEGPCSDAELSARATQIVAHGLKRSPMLPEGAVLHFRVVIASLDARVADVSALLARCESAMTALRLSPTGSTIARLGDTEAPAPPPASRL